MVAGALSSLPLLLAAVSSAAVSEPPSAMSSSDPSGTCDTGGIRPDGAVPAVADTARDEERAEKDGGPSTALHGQWRQRYESAQLPGFGFDGAQDSALLQRLLLQADLRYGARWRVFAEIDYLAQHGRDQGAAPTDVDRLDLSQGYVEASQPLGGAAATLRLGRQEMALGSSRLVSVRASPNARRAFDALRIGLAFTRTQVDVIHARPVEIRPGRFDNRRRRDESLSGIYASRQLADGAGIDAYLLRLRRDHALLADANGAEQRDSAGLRPFGRSGAWDWDVEAVVQGGHLGAQRIRAWTLAADAGWTMDQRWKPRWGLKADIASGDGKAGDGRLGTFNALYPKLPYFSEAGLVAPANLIDLHPSLQLQPLPSLQLSLQLDLIWRHRRSDAVYAPPLQAYADSAGAGGRFVARQWIVDASWQPLRDWELAAQWVRFEPGALLRGVGAQRGRFLAASATWRF